MQLTMDRPALATALNLVLRGAAAKSTLPVLGCVLLDADADRLQLRATNLELAMTLDCPATVQQPGQAAIPAHLLADWVRAVADGSVSLTASGTRGHSWRLTCGRATATMRGLDPDDFPRLPIADDVPFLTLPASALATAIAATEFAAAPDSSRPVLSGLLVRVADGRLTLCAADGYRLAEAQTLLDGEAAAWQGIIPAPALRELGRLLDSAATVALHLVRQGNQAVFRTERASLHTRLLEGQFPDYQKIVPKAWTTRAVVNRAEAMRATRAASVFARDNSMIVRLDVQPATTELAPGQLTLAAASQDMGSHDDALDAAVEGDAGHIGFNGKYLLDALEALPTEQVAIEINGPSTPGCVRPVGADGALYVVMPMTVNETVARVAEPAAVGVGA